MKILFLAVALSMAATLSPAVASAQDFLQDSDGLPAPATTDAVGRSLNPFSSYAGAGPHATDSLTAPDTPAAPVIDDGLDSPQSTTPVPGGSNTGDALSP